MLDKVRVLLIEDDPGIRMTLEDRLAAEGCIVASRADGLSGEVAAKSGDYDIVLLDLMLPGRDGLSLCRNLRAAGCRVPVIMLTARGADMDIVVGLKEGADDYVPKPFDSNVLIARMEALLRRTRSGEGSKGNSISGKIRFGAFTLDADKGELLRGGEVVPLNAQEYRLLEFLASNPNRVIGRDEMLDSVWGYDSETTTRTIDVHIARLRQRLGESDLPRHILTIRGRGYKFVP
jgi:DNA-binding response OmpR family regulator